MSIKISMRMSRRKRGLGKRSIKMSMRIRSKKWLRRRNRRLRRRNRKIMRKAREWAKK